MVWGPPGGDGGKGRYSINEWLDFDDDRNRRRRKRGGGFRFSDLFSLDFLSEPLTLQGGLVLLHIAVYAWQLVSAALDVPRLNAFLSTPVTRIGLVAAAATGGPLPGTRGVPASSIGPLTRALAFDVRAARTQPHRLLGAALVHNSAVHLALAARALWTVPRWSAVALGAPTFLTAYVASVVAGHTLFVAGRGSRGLPLAGASGGVLGLYGLTWVASQRAKRRVLNPRRAFLETLPLLLLGVVDDGCDNAVHAGGLVGGVLVGWLCAPRVRSSYVSRRYGSDDASAFGRSLRAGDARRDGLVPLPYLWLAVGLTFLYDPVLRDAPATLLRALLRPTSVLSN